uniref:Uncharacterized protein n=1 Tax=Cyanothece sp. (strain PCC 7425 / ATCC 29141) TaxID=395961 RepID=B8HTJ6_CYAP4
MRGASLPINHVTSLGIFLFLVLCAVNILSDAFDVNQAHESQSNESIFSPRFVYAYFVALFCIVVGLIPVVYAYVGENSFALRFIINCLITLITAIFSCKVAHNPIKVILDFFINPLVKRNSEDSEKIVVAAITLFLGIFISWQWLILVQTIV